MRYSEIDGIRGYASLVVLIYHMVFTPFGHLGLGQNPGFILFNATVAVHLFFILSGDALSAAFFSSRNYRDIDKLVIKRYFRLTMPILLSCWVIYLLMANGLDFHLLAAERTDNQVLLHYLPQKPDFGHMLIYSISGVYLDYNFETQAAFFESLKTAYNPLFWTMAIEMCGSILVFLLLYLFPRLARPHPVLLFLCAVFFILSRTFFGFIFGVLLGYWRQQGWLDAWRANRQWQVLSTLLLIGYVVASGLFLDSKSRDINLISAMFLVVLFYTNPLTIRFFRNALAKWLGAISFPLYAIHFAVLISLTSYMMLWSIDHGGLTHAAMAIISAVSMVVSIIAACLLRWIEVPYLRFLDLIANFVLDGEKARRQADQ